MLRMKRVLYTRNNVVRSLIYGRFKGACELYNGHYIIYDRVITSNDVYAPRVMINNRQRHAYNT